MQRRGLQRGTAPAHNRKIVIFPQPVCTCANNRKGLPPKSVPPWPGFGVELKRQRWHSGGTMQLYDVQSAIEELKEDAVLPHPVRMRDMILRKQLGAGAALEINREFQSYLAHYGETQKLALEILEKLAASEAKKA
jgi:hypothetical protein